LRAEPLRISKEFLKGGPDPGHFRPGLEQEGFERLVRSSVGQVGEKKGVVNGEDPVSPPAGFTPTSPARFPAKSYRQVRKDAYPARKKKF
jgi:hypothetical protein